MFPDVAAGGEAVGVDAPVEQASGCRVDLIPAHGVRVAPPVGTLLGAARVEILRRHVARHRPSIDVRPAVGRATTCVSEPRAYSSRAGLREVVVLVRDPVDGGFQCEGRAAVNAAVVGEQALLGVSRALVLTAVESVRLDSGSFAPRIQAGRPRPHTRPAGVCAGAGRRSKTPEREGGTGDQQYGDRWRHGYAGQGLQPDLVWGSVLEQRAAPGRSLSKTLSARRSPSEPVSCLPVRETRRYR